jgi:UDP-4-amino-4-deoxy-L-arabinose formyltransferase/UDP-glucuronic acid dehydrogenase (UDP-4-keto-hexauronic acid decarboxylating)
VHYPDGRRDPSLAAKVAAAAPEILFSFYYRHLIDEAVLALAPSGAFNLHGSLLPYYRGRAPVNWVLVNGERETGVSLHRMVRRADAGELMAQRRVAIAPLDTAFTLFAKLETAASALLDETLPALRAGTAVGTPMDLAAGSYFSGRKPADGEIDWSRPASRIYDLVRAVTHPYPGAFARLRGRILFVWWTRPIEAGGGTQAGAPPGTILASDSDGLVVAAGEGALRLLTVQRPGEPELPAAVLAHAERLAPGDRFDDDKESAS